MMRTFVGSLLLGAIAAPAAAAPEPIPVRIVIVTAFEIGEDSGDRAGEYQAWVPGAPEILAFPAGHRHLRYDPKRQLLLLSTGVGTNRAAASVTALGFDPRFDLSRAYWLVAAIAGVDPKAAPVGSAAWIGDVVDTDYGYAVDPREAPKGWPTGMFARGTGRPYGEPRPADTSYNLFPLNKPLRDWAYRLTARVPLPDSPVLARIRAGYTAYPAAQGGPRILKGAEASGQTFWHGRMLNEHVGRWTRYWGADEPFVMTAMEDSGVLGALAGLQRAGKADAARAMVLRTGSNHSVQPAGQDAAGSLVAESDGLSALQPALDAAFRLGTVVADEITGHWDRYRDEIPGATTAGE
ncbi:MAG: purine nucleoside permease [Sphingomonas fennica]